MKRLRKLHLLLGIFFAPLLLLFVGTGWYQTMNPDRLKSVSDAESFAQRLRVVHTDQIYPSTHEVKRPSSPKVFQYLVAVMSAGVIVLTIAGLILGVRFGRPIWLVWVVLAFGVAVPVAVLWLGQQRS